MQKAVALKKVVRLVGMAFSGTFFTCLYASFALADKAENIHQTATRINGESLIYFALFAFIGYLFFRKPSP